jgi:hypothetical protein
MPPAVSAARGRLSNLRTSNGHLMYDIGAGLLEAELTDLFGRSATFHLPSPDALLAPTCDPHVPAPCGLTTCLLRSLQPPPHHPLCGLEPLLNPLLRCTGEKTGSRRLLGFNYFLARGAWRCGSRQSRNGEAPDRSSRKMARRVKSRVVV